jgi:hypothetical protein
LTPEQHNKYLAWSHLGYGALTALYMISMMAFMILMLGRDPNGPPFGVMIFMLLFFSAIFAAMIIPSVIAGYGLLKHRRWAKTATIIAAVLCASSVPFGTGACVYSFWFLFSDQGKQFFEQHKYGLPPRRQEWAQINVHNQPSPTYVPPSTPPDWR